MHITELQIRNVKRLVAFGIMPEGVEPIILTGDNAAGKSSVLDAIFLVLQNKGLEDPVRHGTSKATIKLTINGTEGTYIVIRTITKKTNSLVVTTEAGEEIKSPQSFLNGLIGSLAFDPLEFMRMEPKEQAVEIRKLVGLDTSAIDSQYQTIFAQRTEVNRTLAAEEALLKAMPMPDVPEEVTEAEVSVSKLGEELQAMRHDVAKHEELKGIAGAGVRAYRTAQEDVERLQKALDQARLNFSAAEKIAKESASVVEAFEKGVPKPEELAAVQKQISEADAINAGIRTRREAREKALRAVETRNAKSKLVGSTRQRSEALTAELETLVDRKTAMVKSAKMPIEGMTFDEEGVFINDVRLDQLSTAQQIRTSAAVTMRGNPKLKIILVREGALLNKENFKALVDAAKEGDYQIFIEKFQEEAGDVGLHIVDGNVAFIDGKSVDAEPETPAAAELTLEGDAAK